MHQRIKKVLSVVRDAWLIVGLALGLLLVLEGGYRLQAAARHRIGLRLLQEPAPPVPDETSRYPYADSAWFAGWAARRDDALRRAWRHHPYRGWTVDPFAIPGITVDSAGLRIVPGGRIGSGRDTVFFLGGSAAWGFTARDSSTIATHLDRGLRRRDVDDAEVVSLAQAGYNFMQGLATLQEQLRFGRRPAVVVFFDGVNEVGPYIEWEPLWGTYGQRLVSERIVLGRRTPMEEVMGLGRHLALVKRIRLALDPPPGPRGGIPESVCDTVVQWYLTGTQMVRSLADEFGFAVIFVWQPTLSATKKRLTDYEAYRMAWEEGIGLELNSLLARCATTADSVMALHGDIHYVQLGGLFDSYTTTVFLDGFGHVTEQANAIIGDTVAGLVAALLGRGENEAGRQGGGAAGQ